MAKGIASGFPISAIGASAELMARWPKGSHGGTYGGNPLGCAAALAIGGPRLGDEARTPPAAGAQSAAAPANRSQQRFLERNLTLPTGALPGAVITRERQRFLEQNTCLPGACAAPASSAPSVQR
jgi:hypothetical protein